MQNKIIGGKNSLIYFTLMHEIAKEKERKEQSKKIVNEVSKEIEKRAREREAFIAWNNMK